MRQRLALARAFLHNPELIYLDEPTAGLDPVAAKGVRELIRELAGEGGHTVILCTHNLTEAQELCTRVAVLEHGRLIALGTPDQLSEAYGGATTLEVEVSPDTLDQALRTLQAGGASPEAGTRHGLITLPGIQRGSIPGLLADLISAGVRVYQVNAHRPTLEDVYFELHRRKDGEV
jgi:ABC-2 type transport system ATP-binding protein